MKNKDEKERRMLLEFERERRRMFESQTYAYNRTNKEVGKVSFKTYERGRQRKE